MLEDLLKEEQEALNHFFKHLDLKAAEHLLDALRECQGMIILTGIGKSGRAFFLSAANALHGDIGLVSKNDVFIMLSKSGESEELLQLVPFLRNKGVKLIAIVNNSNSRLAKACELTVVLPLEKELCPFDLAPTTSTVMQLIFGDVLAIGLMKAKNFSLMEYAANHPAGRIGRRLTLRVKDLMLTGKDIPLSSPESKLVDTLVELSDKRCGCVLVCNKEHTLLGIFTDGDLRRALQKFGSRALESPINELMTQSPRFIYADEMASQALSMMESNQNHPITVLPVVDHDKKVVGLIKMHDIVQSGL
jgi:arabinose-5-phosphate isomerase